MVEYRRIVSVKGKKQQQKKQKKKKQKKKQQQQQQCDSLMFAFIKLYEIS